MKKIIFSVLTFCLFNVSLFADRLDVLMIGNSFTGAVSTKLDGFFKASGIDYNMREALASGQSLWDHLWRINSTTNAIERGGYDVVVLQENSPAPSSYARGGLPSLNSWLNGTIKPLYDRILKHSPNARIVYYNVPAYHSSHEYFTKNVRGIPAGYNVAKMTAHNNEAYEYVNNALNYSGRDKIAYVSNAFLKSYKEKPNRILHNNDWDQKHYNRNGAYLAACMLFNHITKVSNIGLSIESGGKEEDMRNFETIAQQVSGYPTVPWGKVQLQYNEQEDRVTLVQGKPVGEVLNIYRNQKPKEKWTTVQFKRPYNNPVVVAGPLTFRGTDPAAVRVRNITQTSCEVKFQEFSYHDGRHAAEKMSLMIVEEGVHKLTGGTILEAIRTQTDIKGGPVAYSRSNTDVNPTVFAQVTSNNGETLVIAKVKGIDNSDIELDFQPEEKLQRNSSPFPTEDLDVVIVYPNTDSLLTKDLGRLTVDHNFSSISKSSYEDPAIFAATQTENGSEPYVVRVSNVSEEKFDVKLQEDTSFDDEVTHKPETLGYWILETGDLYAQP